MPDVDDLVTPQTTAAYIAALSTDLARMARRQGLQTLGYILDMARFEAEMLARKNRLSGSGADEPS